MSNRYPEIKKIFNDLDAYRDFCREFGHVFNEAHLYDSRTPYGQFERYKTGQKVVNNWREDKKKFDNV